MFFAIFIILTFVITYISIKIVKREQELKLKLGSGLVSSDLRFSGLTLVKLVSYGFVGGFISGAFGLGGSSLFNPLLLSMGVPPAVSSATGMYMVIFSTTASTIA
jgi:uncharacterized membrane protein YfcA